MGCDQHTNWPTCEHLKERAKHGFFVVKHFGVDYHIPISTDMKKLFGINIIAGKPTFQSFNDEHRAEEFVRDLIHSVYLQIRDTVGSEIEQHLKQAMTESISNAFSDIISNKVDTEFKNRLPNK